MSARVLELGGEQCIISVTRDLGEWKRIQDELRTVNHAFCDMIGYSMLEVNATDFLSFTYPDPAYYRMLGYEEGETDPSPRAQGHADILPERRPRASRPARLLRPAPAVRSRS